MTEDIHEMLQSDTSLKLDQNRYQKRLLTALRANDVCTFEKLISKVDLEYEYQYPDYKTCLEIAVSEPDKENFIKLLLQYQAEVNNINSTYGAAPIHFAIENGNLEALKLLLNNNSILVNRKSKNNTPLFMAIKQIEKMEDNRKRIYEDMVEILLEHGANANSPDSKGITPIYFAAKYGLEKVITLMLDHSQIGIDLDKYKDRNGNTARHLLMEKLPQLLIKFEANVKPIQLINSDELFFYLNNDEEEKFILEFMKLDVNDRQRALTDNSGRHTILQLSVEKGFDRVVETLLQAGADPNATFSRNTCRPVSIACKNGFYKIFKMFIDNDSTLLDSTDDGDSLIQITLKGMRCYRNNPKSDYKSCLQLLLRYLHNHDINHRDSKNNTALHYAARNGDDDIVLELLRNGACVGLPNIFNVPPLADINAKTLETYLDECIETNEKRPSDENYEIHLKYSFLVYPNNTEDEDLKALQNGSNNNYMPNDVILTPETDALLYMTQNQELRPLLQHPVITSFLYLKWQRISSLFYANITFYSLFWLCLILYIIMGYGVEKQQTKSVETLNVVTKIGVVIGLILLIIRELFQLLVSPTRYLQSIENWMEVALIFVAVSIVSYSSAKESTKQQLSAIAILLSSAELVLLIGQFPNLSTNVVMLKTVSYNFFKFLLWYCILIIAFALSFYTLFRQVAQVRNTANPKEENEEEEDFFEDPGRSLFKTIVMLTGEFDAGSIKFSTFPVTSHIIFIVFVFMVPIVLFNLLNGLAVSDTQAIRANAELVSLISRIKLISYFENVLLDGATDYVKSSKCWSCLPLYLRNLHIIKPRNLCLKPFARQITLFPHYLPKYKIIVIPNQDNKIEIPLLNEYSKSNESIENGNYFTELCNNNRLDQAIVKKAKAVISKKNNISEFEQMKKFIQVEIIESIKALILNKN